MKPTTSSTGTDPAPGPRRRRFGLPLRTLLVLALAVPPPWLSRRPSAARTGHRRTCRPAPPWQQAPATLTGANPAGIKTLDAAAPLPAPGPLAARLNQSLTPDGAGDFTGVVLDAATGEVLYDRSGDQPRIPASNMNSWPLLPRCVRWARSGVSVRASWPAQRPEPWS